MYVYTNSKFALYGGRNLCARINTLLLLLSEVSTGAVSLYSFGFKVNNWPFAGLCEGEEKHGFIPVLR